jgi:hypothetical protein
LSTTPEQKAQVWILEQHSHGSHQSFELTMALSLFAFSRHDLTLQKKNKPGWIENKILRNYYCP